MRYIKTATGKSVKLIDAVIYVREAFKKTIQFLPEENQRARMAVFNKTLYQSNYE